MDPGRARTAYIILNPTSGAGEGKRARSEIERELERRGLRCVVVQTEAAGHAFDLARRAAEEGESLVVAAGGDGTIHDVANGILRANTGAAITLGLLPIGRGNDFVKVVPGTRSRDAAYDTLAAGAPVAIDAGLVEWEGGSEYFLNAMGTGIDVEVVRQIARTRNLPASLVYIVGLAKAFVRFQPIPLRITEDGRSDARRVMIVAVANGTCVGGSFRVSPGARPDDGRLDVCVVDQVNLAGVLRIVPRIMRGTHAGMPGVHTGTAQSVTIDSTDDSPLFFQLDGELREPPGVRRLRVTVVPSALRVVATTTPAEAGVRARSAGAERRERP